MIRHAAAGALFAILGGLSTLSGGCSNDSARAGAHDDSLTAEPSVRATIAPGTYAAAFESAKTTIRDLGFLLERVDAQGGVITTRPRGSAGVATPWDSVQSGVDQEFEELVERLERVVRVEFVPGGGVEQPEDLRTFGGPIEARVTATVYRVNQAGLRINTHDIRNSTYTVDPELEKRGMLSYSVAMRQDRRLAERLARAIGEPAAAPPAPAHADATWTEPQPDPARWTTGGSLGKEP